MCNLVSFFGSTLFFVPFVYIALYLFMERNFSHSILVRYILKIFTVLGGLFIIICACTTPFEFSVLMPSRGGAKNYVPASIFLVIIGVVLMTLPFYSKHITFSNKND